MIQTQSCELTPIAEKLGSETPAGIRCGDLLLAFGKSENTIPWRYDFAEWQTAGSGEEWRLLVQRTNENWKGYPLSAGNVGCWTLLLLGELNGARTPDERLELLHSVVTGHVGADCLNGHFLLLAYDQVTSEWHVFTDRFGTLHAYYCSKGRRVALGTFSPSVAATSRKRLDWRAISAFFSQGFFPQDRTFLDDVRVLLPASHYVFSSAGAMQEHKRYWRWWHEPNQKRSYDETIEDFAHIFENVMRDHTAAGRVALPISGGLDSRATATTLLTDHCDGNLWAYSYGYTDDSIETRIARRIARTRNSSIRCFTVRPYLFANLNLVLDSVEGFQDVTQCRQAAVLQQIGTNADYVLAAHWGDVWMDTTGLSEIHGNRDVTSDSRIVNHALKKVKKGGREWLLTNVSAEQLKAEDAEQFLHETVCDEVSSLKHIACPDFRVKAFKTDNWSFRWTVSSLRMFQPAAFPRLPFYDTRLTDFFCTVPSKFTHQRQLQIDYLKRFAPDLARITWQARDANLFNYKKSFRTLPRRVVKKGWRVLTGRQQIERNWEVQFFNSHGRANLEAILVKPGLRLHEFVSPSKIAELLAAFYTHPYAEKRGYTVSMLLTLGTWLEKYG